MCGIVGAVAQRNVVPVLIEGLKRLEYRGYDSAGLAVHNDGLRRLRSVGRVAALEEQARAAQAHGHIGIAHTRWATHGAPSEANAHPHASRDAIVVVHNGIIENHEALRAELSAAGYVFTSQTDTEVIAHLVHSHYHQGHDLLAAVQATLPRLHGAYAIAVLAVDRPDQLVCAREGSPLLLGVGIEEMFLASDASALLPVTQRMVYLDEGDVARIDTHGYRVWDRSGREAERPEQLSRLTPEMAELGQYRHFMQKEIHEQPRALADTLEDAVAAGRLAPELFGPGAADQLEEIERVTILACGTSYHAGAVARYWIEALAGLPVNVEIASEFRYRESAFQDRTLIVTISQSGETADTLAALRHAKALGHARGLCICNVAESALVRESGLRFLTRAGPEIGVASTKAFTTQLAALFLLAMTLARLNGRLEREREQALLADLRHLPAAVHHILAQEALVAAWAERFANKHHALFLGRGMHYPIALEGALKLKEISYIHAEAYPAGELKHGPLALVDADMPVIAIAPNDALLEKLKSNLQEVRARGGELYVFADADSHIQPGDGIHVIPMPEHAGYLSPILHVVPLQLLAYHAALQKGTDVDKPRNLAKSVTVE